MSINTTLNGNIQFQLSMLQANPLSLFTPQGSFQYSAQNTLASSQICLFYTNTRSTTGESLDLTSALTDAYNQALLFTKLQAFLIYNHDATKSLTVGGGTNAVFGALPSIGPLAAIAYCYPTGLTVDSTHKILTVTPSTGTVSYDLVLIGS